MPRRGLEDAIDQVEEAALTTDSDQDDAGGHSIAQNDARRRSRAQLLAGLNSDPPSSEDDASRVAWSGDEGDDDVVQRHLQKAQKAKDKAAAKATGKTSTKRNSGEPAKVKRAKKSTTGVGKVAAKPAKKVASLRKERTYGDDSSDDDEDALDDSLPDYLKARKRTRDTEQAMLGNRGLKLPPSYDDVEFTDDERLADLSERPNFTQIQPCAPYEDIKMERSLGVIPAPIAQWLREYQVQGAEFMHEHIVYQKGGLLGDDMGLGKTIQVISALTAAFGKTGDERDAKRMRKMRQHPDKPWYPVVLIICPGSLMSNWHSELTRWGWWQVQFYHSSSEDKQAALRAALSGRVEVVITTYGTYLQNKSELNLVKWDIVIADECHQIKNRKAEITKAMDELNSLCRIGLTGTAIQNKYDELWTLLNWTNPGQFGTLGAWKKHISKPLKTGQSHEATVPQLRLARMTAKKLVNNLLPPFFLRRMKSLIAHQLPKKSDRVVFCPLTSDQQEAYAQFVGAETVDSIQRAGDPCDCGKNTKRGWCCYKRLSNGDVWQMHVFPAMMTLQKLSNHLALLIPRSEDSPDQQQKDLEKLEMAVPRLWKDLYNTRDNIVHYANVNFCGKWKILRRLLDFWHKNGDKVLIFSHSVRLLRMLQMLFQSTTTFNVSYLDGSLSYADRTIAVDDFNADPGQFVFLISTKAGGVGLNITSANKVVIVDPNWNPAYDLQAQDRAFRIGQTRDVEVFRLVSAGTIEEIVYARQIYKQQQANIGYNASTERRYFAGVQENSEKKGEIFGLKNIFSYQGEGIILQDIVNKTNVAESRAGVKVIGLDTNPLNEEDDPLRASVDDADDPDSAMSQLAALVSSTAGDIDEGEKRSSSARAGADAVAAILASAGVEYTHENSEVIGSSKIEAQLSRRAEEAGDDYERLQERVFAESQFEALSSAVESEGDDDDDDGNLDGEAVYGSGGGGGGGGMKRRKIKHRYHPPEDVRSRQFCSMAKHFNFEVQEFALMVEGWTQAQRRACLERFYRERRDGVVRA